MNNEARHCEERPRAALALAVAQAASAWNMSKLKFYSTDCFVVPPRKDVFIIHLFLVHLFLVPLLLIHLFFFLCS